MGGKVYKRSIDGNVADVISNSIGTYLDAMRSYEVSKALEHVMNIARYANQYINETKPWEKSNPSKELYTLLELIKVATILLHPFTPMASSKLASAFGFEIENPVNMEPGKTERYTITDAPILFRKIQVKQEG